MLRRGLLPLAAVAVLLGVVALGAVLGSLPVHPADLGGSAPRPTSSVKGPATPPRSSASAAPAGDVALPDWVTTVAGGLCLAIVLGVVGLLVFQLLRNRTGRRWSGLLGRTPARPPKPLTAESVVAALDEGIEALDDNDSDPRRAVIACWVRLETAAAAAGTPKQPGDTSTELVLRLLQGRQINGSVLTEFAAVYREARYAPHVVDETMRAQARDALRQLRAELTIELEAP